MLKPSCLDFGRPPRPDAPGDARGFPPHHGGGHDLCPCRRQRPLPHRVAPRVRGLVRGLGRAPTLPVVCVPCLHLLHQSLEPALTTAASAAAASARAVRSRSVTTATALPTATASIAAATLPTKGRR